MALHATVLALVAVAVVARPHFAPRAAAWRGAGALEEVTLVWMFAAMPISALLVYKAARHGGAFWLLAVLDILLSVLHVAMVHIGVQ